MIYTESDPAVYIGYLRTLVWALPTVNRIVLQNLIKFLREKYVKNPENSQVYPHSSFELD